MLLSPCNGIEFVPSFSRLLLLDIGLSVSLLALGLSYSGSAGAHTCASGEQHTPKIVRVSGDDHPFNCFDPDSFGSSYEEPDAIEKITARLYAFRQTRTPQDREYVFRNLDSEFTRVPGSGKNQDFNDVCTSWTVVNTFSILPMYCRFAIDWEGRLIDCSSNANDGSRVAYCAIDQRPGFYAWQWTETQQDRDEELQAISNGDLTRLEAPRTLSRQKSFDFLCRTISLECSHVVDWENRHHICNASAMDGSRMAYCE